MASSITAALGSGSGIDTVALVNSLVDNQFSVKNSQLKTRGDALTAQISGVASLKSAITGFSTALTGLVRGGTLTTAPTSSNTAAARVSALSGKTVDTLDATLEVVQLAKPQSAASAVVADRTAAIGTGSFTLTFGQATVADGRMTGFAAGPAAPVTIAIGADNASLNGIAAAINAAKAGVTASIVGDGGGARLVLKGATGDSQAFTLESGDAGLSGLNVGTAAPADAVIGTAAQDALVKLDGIAVRRASNTISNLIENVKLELSGTGTTTLGAATPDSALTQAVGDFVDTYNQVFAVLKEQTDAKTGPLRSDAAALALQRSLGRLPTTRLTGGDGSAPRTLAEIGVATNRDGTLRVDAARLSSALARTPAAVEALFRDAGSTTTAGTTAGATTGIAAALSAIATSAASTSTGLGASEKRYGDAKTALTDQQAKATEDAEKTRTRLTSQFATMDARVAAYKSVGSFLTNQIAAWNKSD